MFKHLTDTLVAWGPTGILLLSLLDSSGIPVAGIFDALLILISVQRPEVAWLCAGLAVAGSTIGSMILFMAARQGERALAAKSVPDGKAAKFRIWFLRYGMITVFVPAMIPIPMPLKLFVISAGVLGTQPSTFLIVMLVARIIRYFGEAWLGVTLGRESVSFLRVHAWQFGISSVALFAALYLFVLIKDKRTKIQSQELQS